MGDTVAPVKSALGWLLGSRFPALGMWKPGPAVQTAPWQALLWTGVGTRSLRQRVWKFSGGDKWPADALGGRDSVTWQLSLTHAELVLTLH